MDRTGFAFSGRQLFWAAQAKSRPGRSPVDSKVVTALFTHLRNAS